MYQQRDEYSMRRPVEVGEEIDVTIEAVGEKGDGVAKKDGFVIFIPNVKKGDNVRIKVTKVLRKVGFGEVVGESTQQETTEESEEEDQEDSDDFGDEQDEEEKE